MSKASVPVSLVAEKHKGLKISQAGNVEFLENSHIVKVNLFEFVKAADDYPIVFAENPGGEGYIAVVMLGVKTDENLFVEDSKWVGGFIPESVRCYPFSMQAAAGDKQRLYIGLYETASVVNKDEGELMFNEDGSVTEWMTETKKFLAHVFTHQILTNEFITLLSSMDLLVPQSLTMKFDGGDESSQLSGFFILDKVKLDALNDEDYLKLRENNGLASIYAHLSSLANIRKLVDKKNLIKKSEE